MNNFYKNDSTPIEAKYVIDTTPNPFAFDSSDSSDSNDSEDRMDETGADTGGAEAVESREHGASNDSSSTHSSVEDDISSKESENDDEEEEDSDDEMPLPLFLLERHDENEMLGNGVNYLDTSPRSQRKLEHKSKKSKNDIFCETKCSPKRGKRVFWRLSNF